MRFTTAHIYPDTGNEVTDDAQESRKRPSDQINKKKTSQRDPNTIFLNIQHSIQLYQMAVQMREILDIITA